MSTAASKAKYQYNKKYQETYWERRARREGFVDDDEQQHDTPKSEVKVENPKRKKAEVKTDIKAKKTIEALEHIERLKEDLTSPIEEVKKCCINRFDYIGKDEMYIKALEDSNRVMNSENKRLINLLMKYQYIIKIGLDGICQNIKIKELSI